MPTHYLKVFSIVLITLISLVGLFNFVVDPFDLFSSIRLKGFNEEKTELNKHVRLSKAHKIRYYQPEAIILGTSRAEYGLDPQHPAWGELAQPVFNLALPNGRIEESFEYLKHAYAHGNLKKVVLAVDFFMFGEQFTVNTDFNTNRLTEYDKAHTDAGWVMDIINSLFTLDAIYASLNTIQSQKSGKEVLYLPDGMRSTEYTWNQVRAKGGHNAVFTADIHHDLLFPAGLPVFLLSTSSNKPSPTLGVFSDLVRYCLEHGIELKIIISPMHAYKLETLCQLGLWDLFEYWKRQLTTIVEIENQQYPLNEAVQIWDFSGYNSRTTEAVPSKDNPDAQMKWYWEGSHYRREFGNDILDCVLGGGLSESCHWGVQLNTSNIDASLTEIRKSGNDYRATHIDDIKLLMAIMEETHDKREELRNRLGWKLPKI